MESGSALDEMAASGVAMGTALEGIQLAQYRRARPNGSCRWAAREARCVIEMALYRDLAVQGGAEQYAMEGWDSGHGIGRGCDEGRQKQGRVGEGGFAFFVERCDLQPRTRACGAAARGGLAWRWLGCSHVLQWTLPREIIPRFDGVGGVDG